MSWEVSAMSPSDANLDIFVNIGVQQGGFGSVTQYGVNWFAQNGSFAGMLVAFAPNISTEVTDCQIAVDSIAGTLLITGTININGTQSAQILVFGLPSPSSAAFNHPYTNFVSLRSTQSF
jgi:hypothetical protein